MDRWVDTVDGKVGGYSRWIGGWILEMDGY